MAATVIIQRLTGAGPTTTDITTATTRSSTSDDPNPGTSNPVIIPGAGTIYTFWVTTRLNATTTPTGTIDNLRWYSDGNNGFGTGITCVAGQATAYDQATGTVGDTGDELTTGNHVNLTGAPVNVFTYNSGSPLSVTGSITNPSTGAFGNQLVYQIAVGSTASPGVAPSETFTWKYDET